MLRRLFARESPFWGFLIGLAVTLVVVSITATTVLQPLENVTLDLRFKGRPPIPSSPAIVHLDIDDDSIEVLGPLRWPRRIYGAVVRELHDLGARLVVLDVRYQRDRPLQPFDPVSGRFSLNADDTEFRTAVAGAGNVLISYELHLKDVLFEASAGDLQAALPRVVAALAVNAGLTDAELARASGVSLERYMIGAYTLKNAALQEVVRRALQENPDLTAPELINRLIPEARRLDKPMEDFAVAWDIVQSERAMVPRAVLPVDAGLIGSRSGMMTTPTFREAAEDVRRLGVTNSIFDMDGILRRPPVFVRCGDRLLPHTGVAAAAAWFESEGATVTIERGAGGLPRFRVRRGGKIVHDVLLRLNDEGRTLLNWTGRDSLGGLPRVSVSGVYHLWQMRYEHLHHKVLMKAIGSLEPATQEQLKIRFPAFFSSSSYDARAVDLPKQQEEMAHLFLEDARAQMAELKPALTSDPPPPNIAIIKSAYKAYEVLEDQLRELLAEIRGKEDYLRSMVKDKIIFVGARATAAGDAYPTPLDNNVAGVNVLSSICNMILEDRFLVEVGPGVNRLLVFFLGTFMSVLCASTMPRVSLTAGILSLLGYAGIAFALFAYQGIVLAVAAPILAVGGCYASVITYREIAEFRARRKLESELVGQTSAEIVRNILENPDRLESRKQVGTVIFTDLAGFTSISERMDSMQLEAFLNRYLELVADQVMERKGYVDKFIGDAVMGVFGIVEPDEGHAAHACATALASLASLDELNRDLKAQGLPGIYLRVGINTGEMSWCRLGSAKRRNFTVIGDAVNVGARFEPLNKLYGSTVLIGEETRKQAGDQFLTRQLDRIRVKGRSEPLPVYELIALSATAGSRRRMVELYEAARVHFLARRWPEAIAAFEAVLNEFPDDGASSLYIERAREFIATPLPEDWDGAFDMGFK